MSRLQVAMNYLFRSVMFFCSCALVFAQPALHYKVPAREVPINRLPHLPPHVRSHVILEFDQPLSAEILVALTSRGATVLQDLPDNGVLVSAEGDVALDHLGIRSAALVDPRSKISPLIAEGNPSLGSGFYLVEFHPDVDPAAARRLILNMDGLELRENPDLARQHLMVYTPRGRNARQTLESLATQDPVAYIFPASANLAAAIPANVCGGALTALGPIGQIIATNGDGWDGPGLNATTLNYVFDHITSELPSGAPQAEIVRAMAEWSKVIQLTWLPGSGASGNRTMNVLFALGAHGDDFPFDGPGGVVAHTFYPAPPNPEPIAGDMHFDDAESWHIGANIDVFSVALHELGHALGLGHSDNPNDVMYPYFKIVSTLADGDKTAILGMYAAQTGVVPPPAPLALTINALPATTTAATISLSGTVTGGSGAPIVSWSTSTGAFDGSSINGDNWTILSIPLAIGVNTITVMARDAIGTFSRVVSVTRTVVQPPSPLVLTINTPPATTTSTAISLSGTVIGGSGSPAVTWTTSMGASDGSSISGVSWTIFSIPLAIGLNTITVTASDATGSVSQTVSITRTVIPPTGGPDTTGPTLTIIYPSSTSFATTLASLIFRGTASDRSGVASVTWSTNTGAAGTASGTTGWSATIPLLVGLNQVIIRATDTFGNTSWRSVVVTRR